MSAALTKKDALPERDKVIVGRGEKLHCEWTHDLHVVVVVLLEAHVVLGLDVLGQVVPGVVNGVVSLLN